MAKRKSTKAEAAPKETQKTSTPELAELLATNKLLEEEVIELHERLANAESTIANLSKKTQAKPSLKQPTFTFDGKDYRFKYPAMRIGLQKLTADEIIGDDELLAKLIESDSAAIEAL